jgi:cytochrome c oxidase subunit 3
MNHDSAATLDSPLQPHFENLEQQKEASNLGMWIFLVTEVMFFGGLFTAYILFRSLYPEAFAFGSHALDIRLGAFNTGVLLLSSLTMALAVRGAQTGRQGALVGFLWGTMALGLVFLAVKGVEYHHKLETHAFPGSSFRVELSATDLAHFPPERRGNIPGNVQLFSVLYFMMTGVHALHMVVGIGVLFVYTLLAMKGRFGPAYHNPIEGIGLYWHFVDIVWIFLFPLLYLIGRHWH